MPFSALINTTTIRSKRLPPVLIVAPFMANANAFGEHLADLRTPIDLELPFLASGNNLFAPDIENINSVDLTAPFLANANDLKAPIVEGPEAPSVVEVFNYQRALSSGNRSSSITVTASFSPFAGNVQNSVTGEGSNTWRVNGSVSMVDEWLKFDFGTAVAIDEVTVQQAQQQTHGVVQWQGSNDDSAWTNLGSTQAFGGSRVFTQDLGGNNTPYRYYRWIGISGVWDGNPFAPTFREFEFSIGAPGDNVESDYDDDLSTGDRTALITVTGTFSPTEGAFENSVDGLLTNNASEAWRGSFNGGANNNANELGTGGGGFTFDFGSPVIIDEITMRQQGTAQQPTYARIYGSNNGSDWQKVSSFFEPAPGGISVIAWPLKGNVTPFRYYRLYGVVNNWSASVWVLEHEFKIGTVVSPAPPPSGVAVFNYQHALSSGDRSADITVTASFTPNNGDVSYSVLGILGGSNGNTWVGPTSGAFTGEWVKFEFPEAVAIDEITIRQTELVTHATVQWQGSNDNSTWDNLGSPQTFGSSTLRVFTQDLDGNDTPYLYYRMIGTAGNWGAFSRIQLFEFSIGDIGDNVESDYDDDFSTGNRSSIISVASSFSPSGGTIDNSVDGDLAANASGAWWSNFGGGTGLNADELSTGGGHFTFDFGSPVIVQAVRQRQDTGALHLQAGRWYGSNDNSTWEKASGIMQPGGATVSEMPIKGNTKAWRYWRWYGLVLSWSTGPWILEHEFKIGTVIEPPPAGPQLEPPAIVNGNSLFSPTIEAFAPDDLEAPFIASSSLLFPPDAIEAFAPTDLEHAALANANAFGGHAIEAFAPTDLAAPFIGSAASAFAPVSASKVGTLSNYARAQSTGNRSGLITVTASFAPGDGGVANMVNGGFAADAAGGWRAAISDFAGHWITFDFGSLVVINQATFCQSAAIEQANVRWQGSNNGTDWTNLGDPVAIAATRVQTIGGLQTNVTGWRYYRLFGVGGQWRNTSWIYEIEFRILGSGGLVATDYFNLGGSGARGGLVNVAASATPNGGQWSGVTDGRLGPIPLPTGVWSTAAGQFVRFSYPAAVVIDQWRLYQDVATAHNLIARWQASNAADPWTDPADWQNIGPAFMPGGGVSAAAQGGLDRNAGRFRHYRLLWLSGALSAVWQWEWEFRISDHLEE